MTFKIHSIKNFFSVILYKCSPLPVTIISVNSCRLIFFINKYFDKILSYSPKLPTDMICIDKDGKKSLVEVEHKLSNFIKHNHPMQLVDYVVCWKIDILENRSYKSNTQEFIFISNHDEKYLAYKDEKIYIIELKSIIDCIKQSEHEIM